MSDADDHLSGRLSGRLGRWSRRKADVHAGRAADAAEETAAATPGSGGAAPVADRPFVPPLPPLAEPEEGELDYERAPAEGLELLARQREEAADAADEPEEKSLDQRIAELSDEERDAIKHLPPIDSLTKDSDFTPFFADSIPEFLQKAAYRALWLSSPLFNFRDGLNDYDENFRLSEKLLSAADGDFKEVKRPEPEAEGDEQAAEEDAEAASEETAGAAPGETAAAEGEAPVSRAKAGAGEDEAEDDLGDADGDEIG